MRFAFAVSVACIATGGQLLLSPVVAVDSYQIFLGAVAVSSIYGGAGPGLLTLALSLAGKFLFFLPPRILAIDPEFLIRTVIFLSLAGLISWAGGRCRSAETKVKVLTGMLPICAGCKKIRGEQFHWESIESYLKAHSDAEFTHSLCPECVNHYYPEQVSRTSRR